MNNLCVFKKEYEEPKEKYNLFSFSVFYMSKYIRHYKNYSKDISIQRQKEFLYNLTLNIQNLEQGFFGDNWYIRIYYDKSLFKFKVGKRLPWSEFINKYKNHKKIQFVEFVCSKFLNSNIKDIHINLFGTLTRLYPIFEENSNTKTIVIFDADNIITKDYFDEICLFEKSKYDYNSFCSNYEYSYYKNNNSNNIDNCYLRCGMISTKVKLPYSLWNYILHQIKYFNNSNFSKLINKLFHFHTNLMPEKHIKTYKDFEYGMDEIVLNYYFKKFMNEHKYKLRVVRYKPMIIPMINTIIAFMKYSVKKGNQIIVQTILKNILKDKYSNDLEKDYQEFNQLFYKNITFNSSFNQVEPYVKLLKDNFELFKELNLPNTILMFINNISNNNYKNAKNFDKFFYSYKCPQYLSL